MCALGGLWLFCPVICLRPHGLTLLRLERGALAPCVPAARQQAPPRADEDEHPAVKVSRRGAPGPGRLPPARLLRTKGRAAVVVPTAA